MKNTVAFILFFMMGFASIAQTQKNKTSQLIEFSTQDISMFASVTEDSTLLFHYFGKKIQDASPFLDKRYYRRQDYGTDNMMYPTAGGKNFREPALRVTHADGDLNTELVFLGYAKRKIDENRTETTVHLKDRKLRLYVDLIVKAFHKENVFSQYVVITNEEKSPVRLHNFYSFFLPVKSTAYYLNSFTGDWAMEMGLSETLLTRGIKSIETKKGVRVTRSESPSFLVALDAPLNENFGEVIGGSLAWSGNYKLNFELDEFDVLNITAGINPYASDYLLAKKKSFKTPEIIYTFSNQGAGGISRNLHDWARNYGVYDAKTIRPTLLNSWEGAYFDFNEKSLKTMIDDAADLGLEMFVLDDGWFGNTYPRNNPRAGLGDWQVNHTKLPKGIDDIAAYAVSKGLQFGIWIEPEMVNPESELAKSKPDWIVKSKGRAVPTIRNQWLLDLTNPAVQDFVFSVFDNTIQLSKNISYIKWDANRHVESVGSSYLSKDLQSHFWIDYVQGLYNVYERIREKYPNIIVQACGSGGGRVDYGALKYQQEVWTSDNTDALSRVFIQYGTNYIFPALVTGSHVSASPNHQTNNQTPLKFRFDLAMSGRLGLELQPKAMSDSEKEFAKMAISNYKAIRDIVMFGDLYRLSSPYDKQAYYSLMYVSKEKEKAVVYAYSIKYQGTGFTPKLRLHGLDPNKQYRIKELNVNKSSFWGDGKVFSGEYLINDGINPPLRKIYDSAIFSVEEI